MVNTPGFHCMGVWVPSLVREIKIPHAVQSKKKKKKMNLDRGTVPGIELSPEGSMKSMG